MKEFQYKIAGKKRTRCPSCGKLGVRRKYRDGMTDNYLHKYKIEVGNIAAITESCLISISI